MAYQSFLLACPKLLQIDTVLKRVRDYHNQYDLDTNAIACAMINFRRCETFSSMVNSNPTSHVQCYFTCSMLF